MLTEERLKKAGLSVDEIGRFRTFGERGQLAGQEKLLREQRKKILDNIHGHEKTIADIDMMLRELDRDAEERLK